MKTFGMTVSLHILLYACVLKLPDSSYDQCDQIGLFLKPFGLISGNFCSCYENLNFFSNNCCCYFIATFGEKNWLLTILTSGLTGYDAAHNSGWLELICIYTFNVSEIFKHTKLAIIILATPIGRLSIRSAAGDRRMA